MKRKRAEQYFNELYDATYGDALTFITGKSGDADIREAVLYDTYSAVFLYLLKEKTYSEQKLSAKFFNCLKEALENNSRALTDGASEQANRSEEEFKDLTDTELSITEDDARERMLLKKAHSYVLQKDGLTRRAFILYFYEKHSISHIAELLGATEGEIYGHLYDAVFGIRKNFLSNYISQ